MEHSNLQTFRTKSAGTSRTQENISEIHQNLFIYPSPAFRGQSDLYQELDQENIRELLTTDPHHFKHCKLKMERHDLAYAKPLTEPTASIKITGRENVGRSFPDDEVCVQILSGGNQINGEEEVLTGKVVGLIRRDEEHPTFICRMEGHAKRVTPFKNDMTRINTIQTKSDQIEVRKHDPNRQMWVTDKFIDKTNDQLLVVKVLKWKKQNKYPLGVVTSVITHEDYLREIFLKMSSRTDPPRASLQARDDNDEDKKREDFRNDVTFTIDSREAEDLDDAISLKDRGETYEIAVHITDVARYISKDSEVDTFAKKIRRTLYPPPEIKVKPDFMLSRELTREYLSLLPRQDRKAITLLTVIDKATNTIVSSRLTLSLIRSKRRLSYEEADSIIQERCGDKSRPPRFTHVEDCLATVCFFTEEHRKCRLEGGWSSAQQAGQSRAHCMVEELMNLYNSAVAEELLSSNLTRDLTPLRCHEEPDSEQLEQFKSNFSDLLPLSLSLSHICEADDRQKESTEVGTERRKEETESIKRDSPLIFFTSVLRHMKARAENRDYHSLVQLILSDDIHPTLLHMAKEFQDLQTKAVTVRSCSNLTSKLGHYGLRLNAYTQASSPMRRYLDLILQRLLHSVLNDRAVNYTKDEIDSFCDSEKELLQKDEKFNLEARSLLNVTKFSAGVLTKLAVVDGLSLKKHEFVISLPFDQVPDGVSIMYRHLKVFKQPEYDRGKKSVTLRWKRRVYSFREIQPQIHINENVTPISKHKWRQIISAVKAEDWEKVREVLQHVETDVERRQMLTETTSSEEHYKEFSMEIKLGEVLQVQIGTEVIKGKTVPRVKLLNVNPFFEVCVEHASNPTMCFSKDVCEPSKPKYSNYKEYHKIWSGLCKINTAYNAVEENNSVILERVPITWTLKSTGSLGGFFKMTQTQKKGWHLEFDLSNCFLCIRLRDQFAKKEEPNQCSDLQDPLPFTWVAHGVVTRSKDPKEDEKKNRKPSIIRVNFEINHQNKIDVPMKIFAKGSLFTVEVIPKKIPYVVAEQAVAKISKANDLVKNIATGNLPDLSSASRVELHSLKHPKLQSLNRSQERAVQEALQNPFTVIQGPPGTGKTVVGVHITYQYHMKNKALEAEELQQNPKPKQDSSSGQKKPKKRGILYCGPSNKAVDIVAEQMMKLAGVLKPLRIYCDQMEMREFPYPGSDLKLSRKSLRDDKPKDILKEISLMYRVRQPGNPHCDQIKSLEKTENPQDFDIDKYKKVLKEAQIYELQNHDVVLCTCSTALNSNLNKILDFRQILIDECAMATEPEAFIPLVSHNPQQIVLLGDHKQVQPIVTCAQVKELGMQQSLFARYMNRALMLDTQYRMHKSICKFPSEEFYGGKLKTKAQQRPCLLLNKQNKPTAVVFGHVEGDEVSLIVSTATGNENSMSNKQEAEQAVRVAVLLIGQSRVSPEDIAILTPYNAQVCTIKHMLEENQHHIKGLERVSVCTIMKSQGSEWRYVIISMVRSCSSSEMVNSGDSSSEWMGRKLGFITDPNQVNVSITRAQDGLCILGNRHLLNYSGLWRKLLSHYQTLNCVLDPARNIKVIRVKSKSQSTGN